MANARTSRRRKAATDDDAIPSTGRSRVLTRQRTTMAPRSKKRAASPEPLTQPSKRARSARQSKDYINPTPSPITRIASGKRGHLFVHGDSLGGQLGLGPDVQSLARPKLHTVVQALVESQSMGLHGIVQVAAGGMHSLLLDSNGQVSTASSHYFRTVFSLLIRARDAYVLQVWSFGDNDELALGRKTEGESREELETRPERVSGLDRFRITFIAASDCLSVALSDQGELFAWGAFRSEGPLGFDGIRGHAMKVLEPTALPTFAKTPISSVACGNHHVLALTRSGLVYTWGNGVRSQLGRKIMERRVANGLRPEPLRLRDIVLVSAGSYHSFAVDKTGVVYSWGLNQMRQTGISDERGGEQERILMPTPVDALHPNKHEGARYGAVAVPNRGRLGLSEDHPAMTDIVERHQEELDALRRANAVKAGRALQDEPIPRLIADSLVREPVRIAFPPPPTDEDSCLDIPPYASGFSSTKIIGISCGERYNLAFNDCGILYSWGEGTSQQLGLGDAIEEALTPTRVRSKTLKGFDIVSVSAGGQHVLAV
ncbi:hypothetical protein EW146_g7277 [Bondarzewia mesenterica]|uniref:RCC1-like domain-containing protein n=1 Tax=Bondarzewia mesenterica TaxID=1095465 RepID=A0A4S4LL80_9AGAM|nr:hypothetical protein EW146_g7277 [Bondarzewia mesenterica]